MSTQFEIEQPVIDAGGWRVLAPFKFREYRLLIAAVSSSIFAEGMWAVVMALQVIELDNDPQLKRMPTDSIDVYREIIKQRGAL